MSPLSLYSVSDPISPPAKLPFEESARQQASQDMELVISYYCKTRNLPYLADYGWAEILLVLSSLGVSKADLFNCFYAMVAKYIPRHVALVYQVAGIHIAHVVSLSRDCKADGRPFHLFRLLLLYHDPGLCSFFDTMKLAPEDYLLPWVRAISYLLCVDSILSPSPPLPTSPLSSPPSVPQSVCLHMWAGGGACDVGSIPTGERSIPCPLSCSGHDTQCQVRDSGVLILCICM